MSTLWEKVGKKTGRLKRSNTGSATITEDLPQLLFQRAVSIARGSAMYDTDMLQVRPAGAAQGETSRVTLWLGQSSILAEGADVAELLTQVTRTMKDMSDWDEVQALAEIYLQMVGLKDKIEEEIEVLSLRKAFPGHCRLCPV